MPISTLHKTNISLQFARRLTLHTQLLDGKTKLPQGKEGVAQAIEKLGYVQIDPLAVIERAHHHTLWTRQPDYERETLHELQAQDRRVFEYWTHALAYLPMSDYRYCLPRMQNFHNSNPTRWVEYYLENYGPLMQPVLERIRQEGPLSSKDFESPPQEKQSTGWSLPKEAKGALELLFWKGDLMVSERRNNQKIYDLTERVLPDDIDTRYPDDDELGQFLVRRALTACGLAQEREIQLFMQPESPRDSHIGATSKGVISKSLSDLVEAGEVFQVEIEEIANTGYYALADVIKSAAKLKTPPPQVHLLSPFDSFIIQRERIKQLFGFDYTLEAYLTPAKRRYGYYVLPILWSDNFVGRLDPKADRKKKALQIRNLVFEPEFKAFEDFLTLLAEKLHALARFNRCTKIELEKVLPAKIKTTLQRFIDKTK
ncbi:MAG: winged helix-turn-helix domain-containing protein [bacterium]